MGAEQNSSKAYWKANSRLMMLCLIIWFVVSFGLGSTLLYIFLFKGLFFVPGTETFANTPDNWLFSIQPEAYGVVGALLNFGFAFLVSRFTAPVPDHIQHLVEDVRVPKSTD